MPSYTYSTIYLGTFADMDPNEANTDTENAADFLGSHAALAAIDLSVTDSDSDGFIRDDEGVAPIDTVQYDLGSGAVVTETDSTVIYTATVTRGDDTTFPATVAVLQMANGDTFIISSAFDGEIIKSIELTSTAATNQVGSAATDMIYDVQAVCLASGAMVDTARGPVAVEALQCGDLLATYGDGYQPLLYLGQQVVAARGRSRPVVIEAQALGPGQPAVPLEVSPQHRVLVTSPELVEICGLSHAFVAAKHLVGLPGIGAAPDRDRVTYWHLLMQRHQVVRANGAWVETLFLGAQARNALPRRTWTRVAGLTGRLDPDLFEKTAYPTLVGAMRRALLNRLRRTGGDISCVARTGRARPILTPRAGFPPAVPARVASAHIVPAATG